MKNRKNDIKYQLLLKNKYWVPVQAQLYNLKVFCNCEQNQSQMCNPFDEPHEAFCTNLTCKLDKNQCKNRNAGTEEIEFELFNTQHKGFGLRCKKDIKMYQQLLQYTGEIFYKKSALSDKRLQIDTDTNKTYIFELDKDTYIDARYKGNLSRFVNHSHSPNVVSYPKFVQKMGAYIQQVWFYALKDIKAGTELVLDYGFTANANFNPHRCYCNSTKCTGYLEEGFEKYINMKDWCCQQCLQLGHSKKQCKSELKKRDVKRYYSKEQKDKRNEYQRQTYRKIKRVYSKEQKKKRNQYYRQKYATKSKGSKFPGGYKDAEFKRICNKIYGITRRMRKFEQVNTDEQEEKQQLKKYQKQLKIFCQRRKERYNQIKGIGNSI